MDFLQYVEPIVKWGPTLLFLLIVLIATFSGFCRGYRKSLIFLIHSVVIGGICIVLFFLFKESKMMDKFLLSTINFFLGSKTGLQKYLGVSTELVTLKQVILEFMIQQFDFFSGLSLILADNGKYLLTLIDLAYSIVFALLFLILYYVFDLIMSIIYYIFYSDRKYKRKNKKRILKGKAELRFTKKRFKGSLIGLARGLVSGLIAMSLLGSLLFVVAGGRGDTKSPEYDFGNEDVNNIYNAYASISEYGSYGIFKILNAFKDSEDVPYYLFAADVIFSGKLEVNEMYTKDVIFREEFATYVDFTKDVFDLMMKYGADDIRAMVASSKDVDTAELVLEILLNEDFQNEFEKLINDFDTKVYFSNLVYSFLDSFLSHVDEIEFTRGMERSTLDLLCILFKEGYLSDSIPYEKALKNDLYGDEKIVLGNLSTRDIINKQNIIVIFRLLTELMTEDGFSLDFSSLLSLDKMGTVIDYMSELTLFSPENEEKLNNVYRRVFAYVRYNFLEVDNFAVATLSAVEVEKQYYIDKEYDSINWISEIRTIIKLVDDLSYISQNFNLDFGDLGALMSNLFEIFKRENDDTQEMAKHFDKILNYLTTSKLVANIISSKFITGSLNQIFTGAFENFTMPELNFANTYDDNGKIIEYGEAYYFITALRELLNNPENEQLIAMLFGGETNENTIEMITNICGILTSESNKETINNLLSSKLFRSLFTAILSGLNSDETSFIYLDDSIVEIDNNGARTITKEEISTVLYMIPDLLELAGPLLEGGDADVYGIVSDLLASDKMDKLLSSRLIEGTISNILVENLQDSDFLVLPKYLVEKEKFVSTHTHDSEVKILINVLRMLDLDLAVILDSGIEDVLDIFVDIKDVDLIFESGILYYTISDYFLKTADEDLLVIKIVIPASVKVELKDDNVQYLIEKSTLKGFFVIAKDLIHLINDESEDNEKINTIFRQIVENNVSPDTETKYLSNYILSASIMNYLVNGSDTAIKNFIKIPKNYYDQGDKAGLISSIEVVTNPANPNYYDDDNHLHLEASRLCNVLYEILGENLNIFDNDNTNRITDILKDVLIHPEVPSIHFANKTRFDVVYESEIISCTMSDKIASYLKHEHQNDGNKVLISKDIKYSSLIYDKETEIYHKEELYNFIVAMNALGLTDLDGAGFNGAFNKMLHVIGDEVQKQKVYNSTIALGLVTKMIEDVAKQNSSIRLIDKVYNQEYLKDYSIKVFNTCEIDAFVNLLGNDIDNVVSGDLQISISNYTVDDIRKTIFDLNSDTIKVNSYLMIASVTASMEKEANMRNVYIPVSEYDLENKIIREHSFLELIDAMEILGFGLDFNFENNAISTDNIDHIADSAIIRATISKKLSFNNGAIKTAVEDSSKYYTHEKDFRGTDIYYLSKDEFVNFFTAVESIASNDTFNISFNENIIGLVAGLSNKEDVYKSSLMRNILSTFTNKGFQIGPIKFSYEQFGKAFLEFGKVEEVELVNIITQESFEQQQPTQKQFELIFNKISEK